jgi:hypothetical protein
MGSVTITTAASKKAKDIGFVINIIGEPFGEIIRA